VSATLQVVISKLQIQPAVAKFGNSTSMHREDLRANGYVPCSDMELNAFAVEDDLIRRLRQDWALYPDHVVFLGSEANILRKNVTTAEIKKAASKCSPFIFLLEDGVYENLSATPAQKAQIRCYYDVLARLTGEVTLKKLNVTQIAELLDWDAEKYRQNLEQSG
jgi:rhamnose utilization protein RhaD (predicted bifunctional aldolase and dehydrogenase)